MKGLDEWITRDDRQELPEEVYKIEGYEDIGNFTTEEDAIEYALNHTHLANEREFITDYIYKEVE